MSREVVTVFRRQASGPGERTLWIVRINGEAIDAYERRRDAYAAKRAIEQGAR